MINSKKGEQGFTIGELLVIFLAVSLIVFMMNPIVKSMYERSNKIFCMNNMQELGRVIYIYAKEHQGNFPADIKELYDQQYLNDPKYTDCPATGRIGTPEDPEYLYTKDMNVNGLSTATLIKDLPGNHEKGTSVLTVNGTVLWETYPDK